MALDPTKVLHTIRGAATIAELFAGMFRLAALGLDGSDVATLLRHTPGDIGSLGWSPPQVRASLVAHIDGLALRDPPECLRLRKPERERLVEVLGGPHALGSARLAFLVAYSLEAFLSTTAKRTRLPGHETRNPPER